MSRWCPDSERIYYWPVSEDFGGGCVKFELEGVEEVRVPRKLIVAKHQQISGPVWLTDTLTQSGPSVNPSRLTVGPWGEEGRS